MLQRMFSKRNALPRDTAALLPRLLEHIEQSGPINCPLVLISQISRSGGTWLSQLFDHHPQLWAHPLELRFGRSLKWDWPELSSLGNPEDVWHALRYAKAEERFGAGTYFKGNDQTHPMLFSVELQHALFLQLAANRAPSSDREWLDTYFTSFFAAWLDYQRRYGPKRNVVAFTSMLALSPASMAQFRQVYPDGWLVSIIREPLGWYASIKQRSTGAAKLKSTQRHYAGPDEAEATYLSNVQAIHDNRALFGDRFLLADYGDLVSDVEATMKTIATRLGLDWHPALTRQTFNGMAIQPNTAFDGAGPEERKSILTADNIARINNGPMMAAYLTTRSG
jgi:hypothetical protein